MKSRIIVIGQNETARCSQKQDNISIMVMMIDCTVAVVLKDQYHNTSVTLVDSGTDLKFIQTELELMEGDVTIDVVMRSYNSDHLAISVQEWLKEHCAGLKNAMGIPVSSMRYVTQLDHAALWVRKGQLLGIGSVESGKYHIDLDIEKQIEDGSDVKSLVMRYYSHRLISLFEMQKNMPDIVFDKEKGWCTGFRELSEDLRYQVSMFQGLVDKEYQLRKALILFSIEEKNVEFRNNIEKIIELLKRLDDVERKYQLSIMSRSVVSPEKK